MNDLKIVDSKLYHCGRMARNIRLEQSNINSAYGIDVHQTLCAYFERSMISKTAILDGKVVSMGGAYTDFLSDSCYVWFAIADGCQKLHFPVIRELVRNMRKIFQTKNRIISLTDQDDETAVRMARFLGFNISQDVTRNYGNRSMMEIRKEDFRR